MLNTRFFAAILTATLAGTACSDATAPSRTLTPSASPAPSSFSMYGVVHATGSRADSGLILAATDGTEYVLIAGAQAEALNRLDGDEVEVRGTWDGGTSIDVGEFVVRRVNGADVVDGTLVELRTKEILDSALIGYALRMSDGSFLSLTDPPAAILSHIGARMWIVRSENGQATAYGIIAE